MKKFLALLLALMEYALYGVSPDFTGINAMAWNFIRSYADADRKRYEMTVARRRAAAEKRWEKEAGKANASKTSPSPPLASTSAAPWPHPRGGCRGEAVTGGAAAKPTQAPSVTALGGATSPRGGGKDESTPSAKKEEQAFGNIEWMENHVYRDENGVIRYR